MSNEKHLSDREANELIESYLNGGSTKPKKDYLKQIKDAVSGVKDTMTTDKPKRKGLNKTTIDSVTSKGIQHVMAVIRNSNSYNDCIDIISNFDTRGLSAIDFTLYINNLIDYKVYDKISEYINYMRTDPTQMKDIEMNYFFIRSVFTVLNFESDEQKEMVKRLLKL